MTYVHVYYEFVSINEEENELGANLRKHAGNLLFGLLRDKGNMVFENEKGCQDILNWALEDQSSATGETLKIIRYNINEMSKALKAIKQRKTKNNGHS